MQNAFKQVLFDVLRPNRDQDKTTGLELLEDDADEMSDDVDFLLDVDYLSIGATLAQKLKFEGSSAPVWFRMLS